ncbi:MAG: bifunctional folylpolyglutamate synthase/dihydrofolate synthase [Bacteroidia bacterium]|nr:bifunctional folylpolyglutamate synthase/dihydrofolate synthase [Bacteroidia bacterium]
MEDRLRYWTEWLYGRLKAYEQSGRKGLNPTLAYMQAWDERLGYPHRKYPIIHVAGTNGKGSTAAFLASILQAAGYKVGLHTSPHLWRFTERMLVNGQEPSIGWIDAFLRRWQAEIEALQLSFFEATVGMSLQWFADAQVDIAVVEVGLGGRWDATNIVQPLISVITPIGWDHVEILGPTLTHIAGEKAGIIKAGRPVVVAPAQPPEALPVFQKVALEQKAPLTWAPLHVEATDWVETPEAFYRRFHSVDTGKSFVSPLTGDYQAVNLSTVLSTLALLRAEGWAIPETALLLGIQQVTHHTRLRGRAEWKKIGKKYLLLDVAHNPHGFQALKSFLKIVPVQLEGLVIGFSREKDIRQCLEVLGGWEGLVFFTQAATPRALEASALQALAQSAGYPAGQSYPTVSEALAAALKACDTVLVTGSVFVVAEALRAVETTP